MKIAKNGFDYIIEKRDGTTVTLSAYEAGLIVLFIRKENLRDLIIDVAESNSGDAWDMEKAPNGFDSFIDEIFEELEDEIDYGNSVSEDEVYDKIVDLATIYDMML